MITTVGGMNLALAFTTDVVEIMLRRKAPFCAKITNPLAIRSHGGFAVRAKDVMEVVNAVWPGVAVGMHFASDLLRCVQGKFPLAVKLYTTVNGVAGTSIVVKPWHGEVNVATVVDFFHCLPLLQCTTTIKVWCRRNIRR
jgi:hypothetical protein